MILWREALPACMDTDQSVDEDATTIVHRVLREHGLAPYDGKLIRRPPLKDGLLSAVIPIPNPDEI